MIYTNKYGLSPKLVKTLIRAHENDKYDKGDSEFSVTELIAPARQRVLMEIHKDEITMDVTDVLFSLYGRICHSILERANDGGIVEKRFFAVVNGTKISAQVDVLDEANDLYDWKFTSAWGFTSNKDPKAEWSQQLNLQALIIEQNDIRVRDLHIVAPLRDWQKSKFKIGKGYPPPIVEQEIEKWTHEDTARFAASRIYEHHQAKLELPECSSEETWKTRRCADYCSVSTFCDQYQKTKTEQKEVWF